MTDRAAGFFGPPVEGLSWRRYGRVALLGALGAAGMLTGTCASVSSPPGPGTAVSLRGRPISAGALPHGG